MNLAYCSESEDRVSRLWRKQRKLEALLCDGEDYNKPPHMHWHTHERICERIERIEAQKDAHLLAHLCALGFASEDDLLSELRDG